MWDELSIERAVSDRELVAAVAQAMAIDRERIIIVDEIDDGPVAGVVLERAACTGDFALRVGFDCVPGDIDRVAFYRAFAAALACKLLVDDGEANPTTALLVTRGDIVRVNIHAGVVTGLYEHVDSDDVPDRLQRETTVYSTTRGAQLARILGDTRCDEMAMAAYTPELQDAEHQLTELLRTLVHRRTTPDDARVLRRTCAVLRETFAIGARGFGPVAHILRCADDVLAAPWDPDEPV